MMKVDIVTAERRVYSGEADLVLAPGLEGQLGILPKHAALIAQLDTGELVVRSGGQDLAFAIGGGFIEVSSDQVTVLAESAERSDEIDVRRAEAARQRAAELARRSLGRREFAQAEMALRRSLTRLRVARHTARRGPRVQPRSDERIGEG